MEQRVIRVKSAPAAKPNVSALVSVGLLFWAGKTVNVFVPGFVAVRRKNVGKSWQLAALSKSVFGVRVNSVVISLAVQVFVPAIVHQRPSPACSQVR